MRIGIVALAAVGLITPTYAQKRATKTQPAVPYSTRYSNSVAGITCENATARLAGVMSDEPILNRIPALKTAQYLATKGEFETTADYVAKQAAELRALFGTTKTVVITRSLDSIAKYDADTGVLTIKVFSPRIGEEAEPAYHFGEVIDVKDRGKYVASNAYGATATVSKSSWSVSQYGFDTLPNGALMELTLPVKGEAARAAKTYGKLVVIAQLEDAKLFSRLEHDKPTIDKPEDEYWNYNFVRVQPMCAFLGIGGTFGKIF